MYIQNACTCTFNMHAHVPSTCMHLQHGTRKCIYVPVFSLTWLATSKMMSLRSPMLRPLVQLTTMLPMICRTYKSHHKPHPFDHAPMPFKVTPIPEETPPFWPLGCRSAGRCAPGIAAAPACRNGSACPGASPR